MNYAAPARGGGEKFCRPGGPARLRGTRGGQGRPPYSPFFPPVMPRPRGMMSDSKIQTPNRRSLLAGDSNRAQARSYVPFSSPVAPPARGA